MNKKQIIATVVLCFANFGVWIVINRLASMLLPKWWDVVVSVPIALACVVFITCQVGKRIIYKL